MTLNSALLHGQTALHRLTLELEAERARFLAAQAVARIGSWETDLASLSVAWSQELHRIFETDPDTFQPTHERFLERVHPDDRDGVADAFARSIGQPDTHTVEHRLLMPDGRVKFVEERWRAVSDERGRPHRALGTCQDVTERREAADALEALAQRTALRERMLSTMLSSISDFTYIFDRDGRFLYANQPLLDLWAIPLKEVLGKNFLDLGYSPELAGRLQGQVRGVIETKESIRDETHFTSQSGASGYYEYRFWPAFGADGRVDFVVGSARDVTERKRSDEAMRQAEEKYRSIFENSNDGIFQNQLDGRFIAANPALARMLGFDSPEELMQERTDLEQQSYVEPGLRAEFKRLLDDRSFINGFEYEVLRKDGSKIWVSENVRLVRDAAGEPLRYEGSVQDISARKRSEAELLETHRELLEVSRSAGRAEVATNVLHNVGNVLNSVNVSANLLLESVRNSRSARMAEVVALLGENKADLGHYITGDPKGSHIPAVLEQLSREWGAQQQVLVRELESLRGNIDHIKQIVAMQQGHAKVSAAPESVSVADLVEDTLRVQGAAPNEGHVRIVREFEDMPEIRVEKHKVLQILVNLVRNARLACAEQGDTDRRINVQTALIDGRVRIVVSDNGSGIAPENITRIFSHGFTTRKDGHGFGLHSGALAAAELGGSLSAHSEGPGKGATFTLDLPTQPPGARA